MRMPVTPTLFLPTLLVCYVFFGDSGVFPFLFVVGLMFLIEVRIRFGDISRASIVAFINTPIKKNGLIGEEIVDRSPRVSMFKGVVIILAGSLVVFVGLIVVFEFL